MASNLEDIYDRLYAYCEAGDFAGHDPFDGLNSVLFQLTPLKHVRLARLAWLQLVKRSPVDLRGVLRVEKGVNPKGVALFALAELSRFRATGDQEYGRNARLLMQRLLATKISGETADGRSTTAFGYNFDWQSRHFFAPRGTPAIVPTAFAARALIEAYEAFGDQQYLDAAKEICTFILTELERTAQADGEISFSYTPVDSSVIYNASLLAGETLARVGGIIANCEYTDLAARTARFVMRRQRDDGSWTYGEAANQQWIDNFHTAYILMSLKTIGGSISDLRSEISKSVDRGLSYWLDNFFLTDGAPKYYSDKVYPIDIHACAVAIVGLCEFGRTDLARITAEWTFANMLDRDGYFYYQVRSNRVVKTPFMRWGQAWMAYAIAKLLEGKGRNN